MSSGFSETFRGDVKAWECDVVEHFTVAYYYEKFEAAGWRFLRDHGVDPSKARTTDCYTRYHAELRKGDLFHIETGLIETGFRPVIASCSIPRAGNSAPRWSRPWTVLH